MAKSAPTASAYTRPKRSGGAVMVRRSTRAGGVFFKCSSAGNANPTSIAFTVTSATATGASDAGGSVDADQVAQQPGESPLRAIAQQRAGGDGEEREDRELDDGDREHEALRGSHALHERHRVDVPGRVAARAHRHRDRGEQHRGEARQIEEAARPIDRGVQLPAGLVHLTQPLAGRLVRQQIIAKFGDRRRRAREQRRVGHAAARLNQLGRGDVVVVQRVRRERD